MPASSFGRHVLATALALTWLVGAAPVRAWEPQKPITILVPGGAAGGAGVMAGLVRDIVAKYKLGKQPIEVKAFSGQDEAKSYLSLKAAAGDPHVLLFSLPNLFTIPLNAAAAYNWTDFTPVRVLAIDDFVLWVHSGSPHASAGALMQAAKSGKDKELLVAGTGVAREDQLLAILLEKFTAPNRLAYQGFPSGGEVAKQLGERKADITVNNPIEGLDLWRQGKVRPLCVFSKQRIADKYKVTATASWNDVPTCAEQGLDVEYKMLRGVLLPGSVPPASIAYYSGLLGSVKKTAEWKAYIADGALRDDTIEADAFGKLLKIEAENHYQLMNYAGLVSLMRSNFLKMKPPAPK